MDVRNIERELAQDSETLSAVSREIETAVVGQIDLMVNVRTDLRCNQDVVIGGLRGPAKTTSVTTVARFIHANLDRIRFAPDLLPADIMGTLSYRPKNGDFVFKRGPIFANVVLSNEINHAAAADVRARCRRLRWTAYAEADGG